MRWLCYAVVVLAVGACSRPEPVAALKAGSSAPVAAAGPSRAGLARADVRLVKDINQFTASANPESLTTVNGTLFFSANDDVNGTELWKSDGTAAGTVLVKDINPGANHALMRPTPLASVNGTLFFSADNGVTGFELWKSDGTAAGTVLVKDLVPGSSSAYPSSMTDVNGTLFFSALGSLWKSDGTTAGTVIVKTTYSANYYLTNVNGTLFFVANDGASGAELWKSDGTAAGTVLVKDISPGAGSASPTLLTNVNGTLFFAANDGASGAELWKSDGTAAGTVLVKDIFPGSGSAGLRNPTGVLDTLYFIASDKTDSTALWRSDGTAAGTLLVKSVPPGTDWNVPGLLKNINDTLYFMDRTSSAWGLWKSNGTAAGTVFIKTFLAPSDNSSAPPYLTDINGTLYFSANGEAEGLELWRSDGTATGTVLVKDINNRTLNASPFNLTDVNGTLFFTATDALTGYELWRSDGTAAGTVLVKDILPGKPNSFPQSMTNVNGTLFFVSTSELHGQELWKSDGTAAGTVLVKDINPGPPSGRPTLLTNVNGTLFFFATNDRYGEVLWKSDGTAAGTVLVKAIHPGSASANLEAMASVNGTLFFAGSDGVSGFELWKSDGTAAGTQLVSDISPGLGSASPTLLTNVNGTLFFSASDGVNGAELWKSDGTAAGTRLVRDIYPGSGGANLALLTNVNGTLFFSAQRSSVGQELWRSDGTAAGTVLVKSIDTPFQQVRPTYLTHVNGTLFFTADSREQGRELWKSDGTPSGTVLVKDICPGSSNSNPSWLVGFNGTLYFKADDCTSGSELWKSDGTAAGTVLVRDIFPGASSSYPTYLTQVGSAVFFSATTRTHGDELWRLSDSGDNGDSVPPTVTCPAPQGALATGPAGANVTYPPATATDDQTASPRLTYSVASGALFPLGGTLVTVTATDDADNLAQCDFTVRVVPPAPTVTAPLDGDSSSSPVAVTGTALAGASVRALEGTTVLGSFTADARGAFRGALPLESRVYALRFIQALGGEDSTPTPLRSVSVRPPPPGLSSPADGLLTTARTVSVSGTGVAGATLSVREGTAVLTTLPVSMTGAFSGDVLLGHGVHVLRFTQATPGGTSDDVVRTVTVQPPAPVLTRPTAGASLVGSTVRVEGTGTPAATARVLEDGATVGSFPVADDGVFGGSLLLSYGPHRLTAVQVAGGQTGPASAPVFFEVRPAAPEVSSPAEGAVLDGPRVAVSGSGAPEAQVEVRESGTVLLTLTATSSGSFTGEVELAPGTHRLSFVQKAGGATSDATGPRSVSVRPAAPVLSAPTAQARVRGPQVDLRGTALAGARVLAEEAGVSLGGTSADASGAFLLRVTLAYGPHGLSLQQEVGGVTGPARTAAFTVIPAPPVLSQPLDGATVGRTVEVRGTALPRARVTLRDGTEVIAQLDADASGAFLLDVSLTHGPHTLTAVQRVQGEDSDATAPVHLSAVFNRAPVADAQELSLEEDGRLAVTLTGHDADDDALSFSVQTPPAHGTLEGTPPSLTYVPAPDFHGADRFTFAVSDGQTAAAATVRLTVTPVNDAPVAQTLFATTGEGQSVALTLRGTDVDGDTLTYDVLAGPAQGRLRGTPPELTYTPAPGFAGSDSFSFRVKDAQLASPPATVSVRVLATTLTVSVSDLSPLEGSPVAFSASLADARATPTFAWDFGDGTASTEPAPRHALPDDGVYTVRVSATDAEGTRQASVVLSVRNAPPVVTALSFPSTLHEAQDVELSALAEDPAGGADTLEYQWDFGDGSPMALGATVRHAFRDDGAFSVVLTVRDEDGGETRKQALLTVTNVPPTATAPERQFIQVGQGLSLQLSARDVAGEADPLSWRKLSGPGAVTPEGLFTWVPLAEDVGEASIQLQVSDDEGGSAEALLLVEVSRPEAEEGARCGCGASGDASGLFALLLGLGALSRRMPWSRLSGAEAPPTR